MSTFEWQQRHHHLISPDLTSHHLTSPHLAAGRSKAQQHHLQPAGRKLSPSSAKLDLTLVLVDRHDGLVLGDCEGMLLNGVLDRVLGLEDLVEFLEL